MNETEKRIYLRKLLIELAKNIYSVDDKHLMDSLATELKKVYADGFRHQYSDIYALLQQYFVEDDIEKIDLLAYNLDNVEKYLIRHYEKITDDKNVRYMLEGFRKFSDHIKLEIGRYRFVKSQNIKSQELVATADIKVIDEIKEQINKVNEDIAKTRFRMAESQRELNKVDEKLEKNSISSITALTIFSAVILAFVGGFSFETGMLQGLSKASDFRLTFFVTMTGFVLFNTIFMLMYLVSKMTGKRISTQCRYCIEKTPHRRTLNLPSCGDGFCTKDFSKAGAFCRLWHKYGYVLIINTLLMTIMAVNGYLWWFKNRIFHPTFREWEWLIYLVMALPVIVVLCSLLRNAIYYFLYRRTILTEELFEYMNDNEPKNVAELLEDRYILKEENNWKAIYKKKMEIIKRRAYKRIDNEPTKECIRFLRYCHILHSWFVFKNQFIDTIKEETAAKEQKAS